MGVVDGLRQAREAYERRDWLAAYDVLSDVAPEDLGAHAELVDRRGLG